MWTQRVLCEWDKFLASQYGQWLQERTPAIRMLSATDTSHNRILPSIILLAPILFPVMIMMLSGLWLTGVILLLGISGVYSLIFCVFWLAYEHAPERLRDSLNTRKGFMDRRNVRRFFSADALKKKGERMSPENPVSMMLPLGTSHGIGISLDLESPCITVAPARSGKTTSVASVTILNAPGAVVTTSTRKDILDATLRWRQTGYTDPISGITHPGGKNIYFRSSRSEQR